MTDEVARLDFATNIGEVTAQVARSLQELQRNLEGAGRAGTKAEIGAEFVAGLGSIMSTAQELGTVVEDMVLRVKSGTASLSELKGPSTLGGQFQQIIRDLTTAADVYSRALDTTSRKQIGQANVRGGMIEPIVEQIEQLKRVQRIAEEALAHLPAESAAALQKFLNPSQISRAINTGQAYVDRLTQTDGRGGYVNPLPAYDPTAATAARIAADRQATGTASVDAEAAKELAAATAAAAKAQTKRAKAASDAADADSELAQVERDLKVYLEREIEAKRARQFGNRVLVDEPDGQGGTNRKAYVMPGLDEFGEVPNLGADEQQAHAAELARAERAAYEEEERRATERERAALQLTRQQQTVNRAWEQALTQEERNAQKALYEAYQNGHSGFSKIGGSFFGTPEGPAKLTQYGLSTDLTSRDLESLDTAIRGSAEKLQRWGAMVERATREFEAHQATQARIAAQESAYSALLENSPRLANLESAQPGHRDLGGFVQVNDRLIKSSGDELESSQELYRARMALARALNSENKGQGVAGGSVFDSFLGGAFGHGFDTHQAFDPKTALGNLAATAGVLARYGYEFKLIQLAITGVTQSIKDFAQIQDTLIDLDAAIESTGAHGLDLGQAFTDSANDALSANDAYQVGTVALEAYRDELAAGTSANTIFQRSVEAVGQAAILTGQSVAQAQTNIIASTTSFQLGSAGGNRINDSVVNASRNFGGNRSDVLNALSTAGAAAQEAGVSPEEMANIVALIQSRTGDNGNTIAQAFDRLVSRQDNQQFRTALSSLGIQETGNVSQEISDMSKAYKELTVQQQQAFLASVGGSRNLKDLLPLLRDGDLLISANARSAAGAGAASEDYNKHLQTLGGQLKVLAALLKDIQTNIGSSGLFAGLEVGLAAVKPMLEGINDLLTGLNQALPGPAKAVLGLSVDFLLLAKALDVMIGKFAVKKAADAEEVASNGTKTAAQERLNVAKAEQIRLDEAIMAESGERVAQAVAQTEALNAEAVAQERLNLAQAGGFLGGFRGARGLGRGAATAGEEAAAGGGFSRLLGTGAGGLSRMLFGPVGMTLGGLAVVGGVSSAIERFQKASDSGSAALEALGKANTADQLKQAAAQFGEAAGQVKQASSGFWGTIVNKLGGDASREIKTDKSFQAFATDEAKRIATEQNSNVDNLVNTAFGPGTSLAQGLQAMKDQGIDAGTQLHAVSIALGLVKGNADSAAAALVNLGDKAGPKGPTGTESNVLSLAQSVKGVNGGYTTEEVPITAAGVAVPMPAFHGIKPDLKKSTEAIRNQLKADGIDATQVIPTGEISKLADAVMNTIDWKNVPKNVHDQFRNDLVTSLQGQLGSLSSAQIAQETAPLDNNALGATLQLLQPMLQSAVSLANPLQLGSQTKALQNQLNVLNAVKGRATDKNGAAYAYLVELANQAEDQLVQAKVKELDTIRQAAEHAAGSNMSKIRSVRKDYFQQEIAAAGNDQTQIVGILDNMTQGEINALMAYFQGIEATKQRLLADSQSVLDSLIHSPAHNDPDFRGVIDKARSDQTAAKAAADAAAKTVKNLKAVRKSGQVTPQDSITSGDAAAQAAQAAELARIADGADPRNPVSQARVALRVAEKQLQYAKKDSADYWNAEKAITDAKYQLAQAESQQSTAAAQASVFPGSKMQAAAVSIQNARAELRLAERGTVDWYKATGDLQKAQIDYAAAVLEYQHNQRLLKIDITDPVAMAAEQVRQDAQQLRNDRKNGAPKDVITADQVKIKQDTAAQQSAAFSQKMSDEKTAFDLQQISATQYLRFLEHQRAILQSIHHKTRQQIDELNQVDEAIKGVADQMNGQWNIGDIKIPTPYEARRYIQATSQGAGYQSTAISNTQNQIVINGTDIGLVQKILWSILGPAATQTTTATPRK